MLNVDRAIGTLRLLTRLVGVRKVRVAVLFAGKYGSVKVKFSMKLRESGSRGMDQVISTWALRVETEMEKSSEESEGKVIFWSKEIRRLLEEVADREGTGG